MTESSIGPYRLGLDLGTGSLGWAVIHLGPDGEPDRVIALGSRIFGSGREPKTLTSLAANRRQARQMRRQRDRYLQRRTHLMHALVEGGLMPADPEERAELVKLNPLQLRAKGVTERLDLYELGRALFHLQQRRGFKSNRKTDASDADKGAMKQAIVELSRELGPDRTVGQFLWARVQRGDRARAVPETIGTKNTYEFYIDRYMVEHEFTVLWDVQARFHADALTDELREAVFNAIFDQRPLRPVDPGRCTLEPDQPRAPMALPSFQVFRIYQDLNALRVTDVDDAHLGSRPLTRAEREAGAAFLDTRAKATLAALKKAMFGTRVRTVLSLENGERTSILGNGVATAMRGALGSDWDGLSLTLQDQMVTAVVSSETDESLVERLISNFSLTDSQAEAVAQVSLPSGYGRLSAAALNKIVPHLTSWDDDSESCLTYDKAVLAAGYASHSEFHSGELFDELPYYGAVLRRHTQDLANRESWHVKHSANPDEWEFGRIANPTVHLGLNQVRTVVNAIIDRFGLPAAVHVEVGRDLGQSAEGRREDASRRNKNEKANDELRRRLQELGQRDTYANRERLKLFDEVKPLDHVCVFTGIKISVARLFTNDFQVDHILPYSRTLDDSLSNKILVHHTANRFKGARSPYEAYGDHEDWDLVLDRAESAYGPTSPKFKRFGADAMDRYTDGDQDFIARQLTDTRYLARITREYMGTVINPDAVVVTPGRLTALLRHSWGLNSLLSDTGKKERTDHRHHAVDAAVIALTDRSTLKRVTDANRRADSTFGGSNDEGVKRLLDQMPLPWPSFVADMEVATDKIVVSHKPDHGWGGQLHEETAYGVFDGPDKDGRYLVAKRGEAPKWRAMVPIYRRGEGPDSALPYKAYVGGSNYCIEISRTPNGRWEGEVISSFQANQKEYQAFIAELSSYRAQTYSGRNLVMRIIAGDTIAIEPDTGEREIMRLCQLESGGAMYFANVREGNVAARNRSKETEFSMLKKNANPLRSLRARRVFVDPTGRVFDPGFSE